MPALSVFIQRSAEAKPNVLPFFTAAGSLLHEYTDSPVCFPFTIKYALTHKTNFPSPGNVIVVSVSVPRQIRPGFDRSIPAVPTSYSMVTAPSWLWKFVDTGSHATVTGLIVCHSVTSATVRVGAQPSERNKTNETTAFIFVNIFLFRIFSIFVPLIEEIGATG